MKKIPVILMLAFLIVSCSNDQRNDQALDENINTQAPQPDTTSPNDFTIIDACEIIPVDSVAKTLNAAIVSPVTTIGEGDNQGCLYVIDPPGANKTDSCVVKIQSTSAFLSPQEDLEKVQEEGNEASVEKLEGFGDQAHLVQNLTENETTIYALVANKASVEVSAGDAENAKKLAELVLSRIEETDAGAGGQF